MRVRVVAQNLHSASRGVARALHDRDQAWLRKLTRELDLLSIDALDVGVGGPDCAMSREAEVLAWFVDLVGAESSLELFLDSARISVLTEVAGRSARPCSFNSIRDVENLTEKQLEVLRASTGTVVVQLAPGGRLPEGLDDRLRWAERSLEIAAGRGLVGERIWIDPVCLPWGDDVEAGRGLLEFLESAGARWPEHRCILGLSNVGWGHADRRRLHRQWLARFLDRGLGAVILDAFDEDLRTALRL